MLPDIFKNINIDRMILLGEGQDAYKSVAQMVLPFMELAKEVGLTGGKILPSNPEKQKRKRSSD
jgi:hypothetical protein